ncbi:arginine deiminase family protein [Mycoplasmoides gallisepticum]|uniref:arginine deiminase n=1 Tax=Mycoplasmoides gallisepticum TaxID=2096 RepID=UPI001243A24C|nr:arginine deiminase family protein [Mycoplasmoides gallisepticum]QEX47260.1 arginine deiminase [Mycoplasmoides gallisepticum]ULH62582.1 arginine deiminase family protein [Mycoplasmoides gallisepticum]ULH67918.1 arginine deiminase family protein [Mycoplasmoides gallisepticum]ULH68647.1 arginine deiminase family protein [Mycoplasmoides gallisepticum]WGG24295.1 arginine deiminase family protein [Mycoplasmoides gallisepticum]
MFNKIRVYSEIGKLRKVLVHTPGKELDYVTPQRLDELLFSSLLNPIKARQEHETFIKLLEDHDVECVQLSTLTAQTFQAVNSKIQEEFINRWLDECLPVLSEINRLKVYDYLKSLATNPQVMIRKMMSGILAKEVGIQSEVELVADPMPNLYFTRDPFASIGKGITLHSMFHQTRKRETIFADFIFSHHPEYKNAPKYYSREDKYSIEGGDLFVYDDKTLVIGVSERTEKKAIQSLAEKLRQNDETSFEKIYAINVPKMSNLMHLDTWLTMLDYDKFLYSPNMMWVLKIWEIDLTHPTLIWRELNESLEGFLSMVIGKKATLIPVAGEDSTQIEIDVETNFDATNFLVIQPGVVVGYDRNYKTNQALSDAGVKVISWNGDQLSLGMGSARCMSMPLYRDPIKK